MSDVRIRELERAWEADREPDVAEALDRAWIRAGRGPTSEPRRQAISALLDALTDALDPRHLISPCCEAPIVWLPWMIPIDRSVPCTELVCLHCASTLADVVRGQDHTYAEPPGPPVFEVTPEAQELLGRMLSAQSLATVYAGETPDWGILASRTYPTLLIAENLRTTRNLGWSARPTAFNLAGLQALSMRVATVPNW